MKFQLLFCIAFLAFSASFLHGQKVTIIAQYDSMTAPLDAYEIIYVCQEDSLIQNIPGLVKLGIISIRHKIIKDYDLDLQAAQLKEIARSWGANLIKIDEVQNSKEHCTLTILLYFAPCEILQKELSHVNDKLLFIINPSLKSSRKFWLDDQIIILPPHAYYRFFLDKEQVSIHVRHGFIKAYFDIDSKNLNRRFFMLTGFDMRLRDYKENPPLFHIPILNDSVSKMMYPDIFELDEFTGALYLAAFEE